MRACMFFILSLLIPAISYAQRHTEPTPAQQDTGHMVNGRWEPNCRMRKAHNMAEQQQIVAEYSACMNGLAQTEQQKQVETGKEQAQIVAQNIETARDPQRNFCSARADKAWAKQQISAEYRKSVIDLAYIYALQTRIEADTTIMRNILAELSANHQSPLSCDP